uniref:BTB domain-containing protein n=1 Tax=Panagrolaimus sp. PS1159 TaxID=55785 RepID=A0AC35GUM1_9BILA
MDAERFYEMQKQRFEIFKSQDFESGFFDVTFEVEGQKIFADKFTLTTISAPFKTMLSERWTKNDEAIELQSHSYANFYRFLTFLYSGKCDLNSRNFSAMVDLAEFYDVSALKILCDERLSQSPTKYEDRSIFHFIEVSKRFSLIKSLSMLKGYVSQNFSTLLHSPYFLKSNKAVIDLFLTCERDSLQEELLFESVFKWAEIQVEQNYQIDEKFDFNEAIKNELIKILPNINFIQMSHEFLIQYVVKKAFLFSGDELSVILLQNYNETTGKS